MERAEFLAALQRDGAAFAIAAAAAPLDAPVIACPEWRLADLVWHLTEVHYFWGSIVVQRLSDPKAVTFLERPADAGLLAAYDAQLTRLIGALTDTDPSTTVWTWSTQQDVAFVVRRMAQETAVHRWDAETAAGRSYAIDPPLASDGIDEYLEHFLEWRKDDAAGIGGSVHFHCGDVPGEWTVYPRDGDFEVTRAHAKGDCALRGSASDLLLALWRRLPITAIDVVGDADVAARFLALTSNE